MSDTNGSVTAGTPDLAGAMTQAAQNDQTQSAAITSAPADSPWAESIQDVDVRSWAKVKGLQTAEAAAKTAYNLEKYLGADKAGRGLVLPKDDSDSEAWGAVYNKLGRPDTVDGYKFEGVETDPEIMSVFAPEFHKLGLSNKQASGLVAQYNAIATAKQAEHEAMIEQKSQDEYAYLQKSWGTAFAERSNMAQTAIRELGITSEDYQTIERAIGLGKAAEIFANVGKNYVQSPVKGVGDGSGSFKLTPAEARSRLNMLKNDQGWSKQYLDGDAQKMAEMQRLLEQANS